MNVCNLKSKFLTDENFLKQMSYKLNNSEERFSFFKWVSNIGTHWQKNPTPYSVIRQMINKTSLQNKKILVIFNIEFLHVLIEEQGVNPQDITFIADNHIEKLSANKIFKVQSFWLKHSGYDTKGNPAYEPLDLKNLMIGLNMKFDLVFSNPPYNDYDDIKILNEIIPIIKEFVIVHPCAYILKDGKQNATMNKFNTLINRKVSSIHFIDPFITFDGVLNPTPCVITHYDEKRNTDIDVSYELKSFFNINDSNYVSKSIDDITIYGSKYLDHVLPFKQKIELYCEKNGSLNQIKQSKISLDNTKFYCQLPQIIGQVNRTKNFKGFYEHTFFTLMPLSENTDVTLEDGLPKPSKKNNFVFNTNEELINFKNYLKTDFVRFCLSFKKFSKNLQTDSFNLIPLMDFTQVWTDEELFEHFKVTKEMAKLIREFLPDCYGIRK